MFKDGKPCGQIKIVPGSSTEEDETATEELEGYLRANQHEEEITGDCEKLTEKIGEIDLRGITQFSFQELSRATRNFCEVTVENGGYKLGEGANGTVFKATIGNHVVAVKRLKNFVDKQFFTELNFLVRCKHENLLVLLGCSINGPKCCLVYEYMINGSLQERLACHSGSFPLSFRRRLSIAYGSALGINHLHTFREEPYVHRDIKSANILLDQNLVPKIGDFGLVRLGDSDISSTVPVTENVCGTRVYMAREAINGDVSVKLDTFSFGVVLLELMTGLPPYDAAREDKDLITHVESCDDIVSMLDPRAEWDVHQALQLHDIAKLCLINVKKRRPTIYEILDSLRICCFGESDTEF